MNQIKIVEVGPRDGLQNEKTFVTTADKITLIEKLAACGLPVVEATSFVSPKWVPQMQDASAVMAGLSRRAGVQYPVLVPNVQGLSRISADFAPDIAVFSAASNAFNLKNINCTTAESLIRIQPLVQQALAEGRRVRGYVSTVLGCPYQGAVPVAEVVAVAKALYDLGCTEISLGDTVGVGTPKQAQRMLQAVASELPMSALAVHFHDTYGQALANIYACLEAGCRIVDASVSGLGGCPYADGASGNVATEDLVYQCQGLGLETGVDLAALCEVSRWISGKLSRPPNSRLARIHKVSV
jgi:hydroxymethylglutaryl-CoA lyase